MEKIILKNSKIEDLNSHSYVSYSRSLYRSYHDGRKTKHLVEPIFLLRALNKVDTTWHELIYAASNNTKVEQRMHNKGDEM